MLPREYTRAFLNYLLCLPATIVLGEQVLCTDGDYFDEGQDRCVSCPIQPKIPGNVVNDIGDGCVAATRACPPDHFWHVDSLCSMCGGRCKPCDECGLGTNLYLDHEGRPCEAYRNRICCEYEHMTHVGDRCVETSTTTSSPEPDTQQSSFEGTLCLNDIETSRPETRKYENSRLSLTGNLRNSAGPETHCWVLIGAVGCAILASL